MISSTAWRRVPSVSTPVPMCRPARQRRFVKHQSMRAMVLDMNVALTAERRCRPVRPAFNRVGDQHRHSFSVLYGPNVLDLAYEQRLPNSRRGARMCSPPLAAVRLRGLSASSSRDVPRAPRHKPRPVLTSRKADVSTSCRLAQTAVRAHRVDDASAPSASDPRGFRREVDDRSTWPTAST